MIFGFIGQGHMFVLALMLGIGLGCCVAIAAYIVFRTGTPKWNAVTITEAISCIFAIVGTFVGLGCFGIWLAIRRVAYGDLSLIKPVGPQAGFDIDSVFVTGSWFAITGGIIGSALLLASFRLRHTAGLPAIAREPDLLEDIPSLALRPADPA